MADVRVLIVLVISLFCVHCAVLTGKAIYCRDPDTGKLYGVNSTWASSSFCGNYTCKVRKLNRSATELPIREINITDADVTKSAENENTVIIEKKIESDLKPVFQKSNTVTAKNLINGNSVEQMTKNIDESAPIFIKKSIKAELSSKTSDNDRYLTKKEIEHITQILHTVKKSDLDAIVDIYNIAQDIYKEMDSISDRDLMDEALDLIKEEERHRLSPKPTSYWYDTLGNRGKMADRYDMDLQATNIIHSTMKPKTYASTSTSFNTQFSSGEFSKVPYYYPITDFQRKASYTHASPSTSQATYPPQRGSPSHTDTKPCENKYEQIKHKEVNRPGVQKLIQPSHFLPYPFASIRQYNISNLPNFYYSFKPWSLDSYNKYKYYQPYFNFNAYKITPVPKILFVNPASMNKGYKPSKDVGQRAVIIDPQLTSIQDVEQKPVKVVNDKYLLDTLVKKHNNLPDWKTDPISIETLNDIRANIDASKLIKAFPFRKKVKLERVGKLINVDQMHESEERLKRSSPIEEKKDDKKFIDVHSYSDNEEYEAYLERVTCNTPTEPGYFRIGNMTHPYPGCCPQLITNR